MEGNPSVTVLMSGDKLAWDLRRNGFRRHDGATFVCKVPVPEQFIHHSRHATTFRAAAGLADACAR